MRNVKKMGAKNLENRAPTPQNRPRGGLGGLLGRLVSTLKTKLAPSSVREASWGGLGGLLGRLDAKLRAKIAPSWVPRRRFLGFKNEAKMDALSGASCGRYFHDFSWILVDIWKAKWIDKKSTKNQSKIEAQDGWHLGIDFWWISMGFGKQVGTQNRIKIDFKRHQKRDAKK